MAWWLFQNAVVTAALAVAVLALCRIGRIGPVARHALWVIVLVKFVTPPVIVWPWPAPDPFGLGSASVLATPGAEAAVDAGAIALPPAPADDAGDVRAERSVVIAATSTSAVVWAIWIWIVGAVGLLALEALRLARLARCVHHALPADPAIVGRVREISRQLGLKPIPVIAVEGHTSPMIWCFGRTRLLWPVELSADVSDACIDGLIVHELAHVKRRDHLVGWVELAAGVLWWWNPLFWFVRAALREQAELACDAWVITTLPNGRRAYAESLLALSGAALRGTPSPGMAVMGIRASSRRVLERRLVMIMKGRAPLRLPLAGALTIALAAAATLPAWATGQQSPPPAAPATPAQTLPAVRPQAPPSVVRPAQDSPRRARTAVPPTVAIAVPDQTRPAPPPPPPAPAVSPQDKRVVRTQNAPPKVISVEPAKDVKYVVRLTTKLPAEGQQLVETYDADVALIYKEIEGKVDARRLAVIKALESLQDQFTKQGKLDEAVAIRDYLKAGGPPASASLFRFVNKGGR